MAADETAAVVAIPWVAPDDAVAADDVAAPDDVAAAAVGPVAVLLDKYLSALATLIRLNCFGPDPRR